MTETAAVAQLTGTGRLADDLYLMAHSDLTGRPYLRPRAAGLGLAAGLLAELALAGRLRVGPHSVSAVGSAAQDKGLATRVWGQVAREREACPAAQWLAFLGRTAAEDVAARLGEAGYLARAASRFPWPGPRWRPVDPDCAFVPITRARAALDPSRVLTPEGAALAGLAVACGLGGRLRAHAVPGQGRSLDQALAVLPADLSELITQTRVAVDGTVLSPRL
jgi:hypothetical protein